MVSHWINKERIMNMEISNLNSGDATAVDAFFGYRLGLSSGSTAIDAFFLSHHLGFV